MGSKKFAKFWHLSWDSSWGSLEVSKKVYHLGVEPLEVFVIWVCKNGLQKICQILASELRFKLGVMRGFQKGITLVDRTSGSVRKVFGGWHKRLYGWHKRLYGGLLDNRVTLSPY